MGLHLLLYLVVSNRVATVLKSGNTATYFAMSAKFPIAEESIEATTQHCRTLAARVDLRTANGRNKAKRRLKRQRGICAWKLARNPQKFKLAYTEYYPRAGVWKMLSWVCTSADKRHATPNPFHGALHRLRKEKHTHSAMIAAHILTTLALRRTQTYRNTHYSLT